MTNELAIGLLIGLFVALGWVVFNVGKVLFAIVRDVIRMKQHPPRNMEHPDFGQLRWENDIWSGQIRYGEREIDFYIAGPESGPDSELEIRLRQIVQRLPELERSALAYIGTQEPSLPRDMLRFGSLDLLFERRPEQFGMGFTLPDDPDGCWRVEFKDGVPFCVGRDD
jgi:hypothetical protein